MRGGQGEEEERLSSTEGADRFIRQDRRQKES